MASEEWEEAWSNPVFSLAEKRLRYEKVRALMRRDGIDVICSLPWTSRHDISQADARYLTQLGENSDETTLAFGLEEVTAWLSRGGAWPSSNWLSDIRAAPRGTGGHTIVEWLRETGFSGTTLAIAGLTGGVFSHCNASEGEANWDSVNQIRRAFPLVKIVSGTALLGEARLQKTEEEIGFLRKSRKIAAQVIDTIVAHARPGVPEREVWGRMLYTYADLGGSFEPKFGWITGPAGATYHRLQQPTFRRFQDGDLLIAEVEGRWGGYTSRMDRLFGIGKLPADIQAATRACRDVFDRVIDMMKPGTTIRELLSVGTLQAAGNPDVIISLAGCGTGDDGPVGTSLDATEEALAVTLVENSVLSVSCDAAVNGRVNLGRWGDTVVVRAEGAALLAEDETVSFYELR